LRGLRPSLKTPVVEVALEVEMEMEKDQLDIKPMMQKIEEYIIL
jgi:hypothetical protein